MLSFSVVLDPEKLAPETIRPLRRAEYDRLVELGVFEDERVELLGGHLVQMSPIGTRHAEIVARLTELFILVLGERARVRPGLPLALSDVSEPEPDVAVVPRRDYGMEHPDRAHLVVEVSDSSLRKDRELKAGLYAASGIPEYWVVNLVDRQLEVFTEPSGEGYASQRLLGARDSVSPTEFPDVALRVGDVLSG